MWVVTSYAGQCTVLIQRHFDSELLFHLLHARQEPGRRLDPMVEIAGMVAADHVAAPAQQIHSADQLSPFGAPLLFDGFLDMAVKTCFHPYGSLGVQLAMGIQAFIVLPVMAFVTDIASVCVGLAAQETVLVGLLAALLVDVMTGEAP